MIKSEKEYNAIVESIFLPTPGLTFQTPQPLVNHIPLLNELDYNTARGKQDELENHHLKFKLGV